VSEVRVKEPRTFVEVLHGQEEVEAAARRAASYERTAAALATARAARYEAMADVVLADAPRARLELLEGVGAFEDDASTAAEEGLPREFRLAVGREYLGSEVRRPSRVGQGYRASGAKLSERGKA
jgi:hypothetical protein